MKTKKLNLNQLQNIEGSGPVGVIYYTACMQELTTNWGHAESEITNRVYIIFVPMSYIEAHSYCNQFLALPT